MSPPSSPNSQLDPAVLTTVRLDNYFLLQLQSDGIDARLPLTVAILIDTLRLNADLCCRQVWRGLSAMKEAVFFLEAGRVSG